MGGLDQFGLIIVGFFTSVFCLTLFFHGFCTAFAFWGVYEFNYVFMFNRGLSVCDEPSGVLLRVCCRIDVFCCEFVVELWLMLFYGENSNA